MGRITSLKRKADTWTVFYRAPPLHQRNHMLTKRELWKTANIYELRREIEVLQRKESAYAALVQELRDEVEAFKRSVVNTNDHEHHH